MKIWKIEKLKNFKKEKEIIKIEIIIFEKSLFIKSKFKPKYNSGNIKIHETIHKNNFK